MRRLLVMALGIVLLGCQQSPAPRHAPPPAGPMTAELRAEGDRLAARGEYEAATVKYQAAVRQEPGDPTIWFALGTVLSHMGRREETIEAFRRVVELGAPESQEVQVAQRWLLNAGAASPAMVFASTSGGEVKESSAAGPTGTLRGKTEWKGVKPEHWIQLSLVLVGDEPLTRGKDFRKQVRLGEAYAFEKVTSGSYRLTASARNVRLWEQPVYIETDKQIVLNLSPANSPVSPDAFPGEVHAEDNHGFGKNYDRYEHARPREYEPPPAGETRR